MKFTCKTDKLKKAVSRVERVVSKQTTLPILGNILIKTEKGQLVLVATNLEVAIKVFISAKIEEEGSITIPPRVLSIFLNNIREEVVDVNVEDGKFYIKSENHNTQIKTLEAKDFPIIPEMPEKYFFKMKMKNVIKAVNGVNISIAHKDTRQELNGVNVKFKKKSLILASTDSFRLMELKVPITGDSVGDDYFKYIDENNSIILPITVLTELQQMDDDSEVAVFIGDNQIFFDLNDVHITSQLLSGHYPDYKQIIPTDCDIKIKLNKNEFLEAIKITSSVTVSQNSEVRITKKEGDDYIVITAQSVDLGESVSKIKIEDIDSDFDVYFNHRYLLEGLNSSLFENEEILMELKKEKSPVLFKSLYDGKIVEDFLYMVMPIVKE